MSMIRTIYTNSESPLLHVTMDQKDDRRFAAWNLRKKIVITSSPLKGNRGLDG